MSYANPSNTEEKAWLVARFVKAAQTYKRDGMGVQNAICRTILSIANELNHPIAKSSVILDNASGPRILTRELLKQVLASQTPELHAADFSAAIIRVLDSKGWSETYGVTSAVMDAQDLKLSGREVHAYFRESRHLCFARLTQRHQGHLRISKPSGIALVPTIRRTGWVPPFQEAQKRTWSDADELHGMLSPEVFKSDWIKDRLEKVFQIK